jgi:CheY-like chemotaxis protein
MTGELLHALRHAGLDVLGVAETGDDAVRIVTNKEADLAIIDTRLPRGLTAGQTADELSKISRSIRIIYVTFRKEDLPISPAHPHLLKPFSAEELEKMISSESTNISP